MQTASVGEKRGAVLIIDAGHGGADGGAVSLTGTKESEINLDIALRLRELCRFFGKDCVMTREREELNYPDPSASIAGKKQWDTRRRTAQINAAENGFLLSIHQNFYPGAQPKGPQVFYNEGSCTEETARLFQEQLNAALFPESRRLPAPAAGNIYIMTHAECPALLAECGFLSNPEEAAALDTGSYRLKIAAALMAACLRTTGGPI